MANVCHLTEIDPLLPVVSVRFGETESDRLIREHGRHMPSRIFDALQIWAGMTN